MRILVTGSKGRLGSRLVELLNPHHTVIGTDADELDITDHQVAGAFLREQQPELVLHTAAMTNVDGCALHPDEAVRVNGYGTKNLAIACQAIDAALLYVSSNEVFDGQAVETVHEYAFPNPINPYGYSKYVGEQVVRDHLKKFYIARTSWLFAHGGKNFIQTILRLASEGQPLRVVVNEVAAPTYNDDLAEAIVRLIQTGQYGIYHLVNEGRASRWAFARKILDLAGYADTPIEKIAMAEFQRPSTPPEYAVLANTAAADLGIRLRPWEEALHAFLEKEGLLA